MTAASETAPTTTKATRATHNPHGECAVTSTVTTPLVAAATTETPTATLEAALPAPTDASHHALVILRLRGRIDLGTTVMGVLRRYAQALAAARWQARHRLAQRTHPGPAPRDGVHRPDRPRQHLPRRRAVGATQARVRRRKTGFKTSMPREPASSERRDRPRRTPSLSASARDKAHVGSGITPQGRSHDRGDSNRCRAN